MRIRALILALGLAAASAAGAEGEFNRGEAGLRYWVSTGVTRHSHNAQDLDPAFGNPTSILTYENLDAHALELYARQNLRDNWFLKGIAGVGRITTGSFDDEDYFAGNDKFSDTTSSVPEGWLSYVSVDIGRSLWVLHEGRTTLGAFVGYGQWTEYVDAYGASFTVDALGPGTEISRDVKVISNKVIWRALRLGVAAGVGLGERARLMAELAFIPYAKVRNEDSHHLRTSPSDLGSPVPNIIIEGTGTGFQSEIELRYEIVRRTEVGLGWRYWYLKSTDGSRRLPNVDFPDLPLVELYSKRFGATLSLTRRW